MLERLVLKSTWIVVLALMMAAHGLTLPIHTQTQNAPVRPQPTKSDSGHRVDDSSAAIKLAERALVKVFGEKHIKSERPFRAWLADGVWHVRGTLYCKDKKGNVITNACVGGVAMADIRQSDGKVLQTGHTA